MKISKIISQIMKVSVVVYRMTDSAHEKERRHTGFSGESVCLFLYSYIFKSLAAAGAARIRRRN